MWILFTKKSPYKKRATFAATGWTLLIFILCLLPGNEIPDVDIPFIDKWAHVILFGVFTFLWLCAIPTNRLVHLLILFMVSVFLGWLVEYIQGHYVAGRCQDNMDILADAVGGLIGILIFTTLSLVAVKKTTDNK